MNPGDPPGRVSLLVRSRPFLWGFASQTSSSITNFGLSFMAARLLGPNGLGSVFVGFSCYLLALGLQRALVSDTLVAVSSASSHPERSAAATAALTVCAVWSSFVTVLLAVGAYVLPTQLRTGVLPFLPWLLPALAQDYWRVLLFRDGRGASAALNDFAWAIVMALTIWVPLEHRSAWTVVAWWGFGGTCGMLLGFAQTRLRPQRINSAVRWWAKNAWGLGRWLGGGSIVYLLGSQTLILVIVPIIGTRSLGGLRAIQVLFGPLSLLLPAVSLPALPEISRRLSRSSDAGSRFAWRLTAAVVILTAAYVSIAALSGGRLLALALGPRFVSFAQLIIPIGIGQIVTAATVGPTIFLKAAHRGKHLLWSTLIWTASSLVLTVALATTLDVSGAAWGMTLGSSVNLSSLAWFTFKHHPPRPAPYGGES